MNIIQRSERWLQLEDLDNEIWKDIYFEDNNGVWDFRGLYQISNLGRVKSLSKNIIIKQNKIPSNYLFVILYKNKQNKQIYVHRLVAYMFIPNNDKTKYHINHIDENNQNNNVNNLEWCTQSYNNNYGNHNYYVKKNHADISGKNNYWYGKTGKQCPNSIKIAQFTKDGKNMINIFDAQRDVSRLLNIDCRSISKCCIYASMNYDRNAWILKYNNNPRKTAGGFIWKYLTDCTDEEILNYIIKKLQVHIE